MACALFLIAALAPGPKAPVCEPDRDAARRRARGPHRGRSGDPAPGARVEAIELRYIRGRRVPVPARIVTTNDAGEFRLSGLEPGAYQVRASTTEVWDSEDWKQTYAFAVTWYPGVSGTEPPQTMNVGVGQEIGGLDFRLVPAPAARIVGVVQDANGTPLASQVVNLDRILRTTGGALLGAGFGGSTRTDAKGAFELPKLAPGEYNAYTGTDTPWDVPTGRKETSGLTITITRRIGRISGAVTDSRGQPTSDATVLVFADDEELWLPSSRFIKTARPTKEGRFSMRDLPAGTYRTVALASLEPGQWEDREFLASLRGEAQRVELAEGGAEAITLRVAARQR